MKNIIFLSFIVVSMAACKGNKTETTEQTESVITEVETPAAAVDTTTTSETVDELYSCPMHPEVKGVKDSECRKCGMPLTEPVK